MRNKNKLGKNKIEEFGGWLLLFVILFFISSPATESMTSFDSISLGQHGILLLLSLIEIPLFIICIVLILNRRKHAPFWIITTLAYQFMVSIIQILFKNGNLLDILLNAVWPAVWILYFTRSKRVKSTFVK